MYREKPSGAERKYFSCSRLVEALEDFTMNRQLLNIQRKQLHDILVAEGIDPAQTQWTNDQKGWTDDTTDTIEIGLCYFVINPDVIDGISIKWSPAPDGDIEFGQNHLNWLGVINLFRSWARQVKLEIGQPDPWAKYIKFAPPQDLSDFSDNSPFSYPEVQQIEESVQKLIEFLYENINNYSEASDKFDTGLNRMIKYAKSGLGRIDWTNQFVGLIIAICLTLSLSPETANSIWRFWLKTISNVYQIIF